MIALYYIFTTLFTFVMLAFWVLMIIDSAKRGDTLWLIILIMFPLSALIYYFMYRPEIILPKLNFGLPPGKSGFDKFGELKSKIERAPDSHLYLNLGKLYLEAQKPMDAVDALEKSLLMEPDNYSAHLCMGRALIDTENYEESNAHLEIALHSKDKDIYSQAIKFLAENYVILGDEDKAMNYYDRLIKFYPFSEARYIYAELLSKHNRKEEAIDQMKKIISEGTCLPSFSANKEKEWIKRAEDFLRKNGERNFC